MGNYQRLEVWQRARLLNVRVYQLTRQFPSHERYGLINQARRSSVSVMANLAEGAGRNGDREMARFVGFSQGSAAELECQLLIARDLGYLTEGAAGELLAEVGIVRRMLARLSLRVRSRANS